MDKFLLNHYIIAHAFISIVPITIGLFVFFRNPKIALYRIFLFYNTAISWWGFCTVMMQYAPSREVALLWDRLELLTIVFIPSSSFHFTTSFLKEDKRLKNVIWFSYLISIIFFSLVFTPLMAKSVSRKLFITYFTDPGIAYYYFIVFFTILITWSNIAIYKSYTACTAPSQKQGILYFLFATIIATVGGSSNFLVPYNIVIPFLVPFDNYGFVIYGIITTYVIVTYRLMDIKVALTRTGIFIAVYTLILGAPFALALTYKSFLITTFGPNWWMLPLGFMAILATAGPFIYIYVQRKAEERLLKEQRRYQNVLKQAAMGMTRIRDLNRLLSLIAHIVTKTVHISYIGIYLYNKETEEFVLQVSRDKGRMPIPKIDSNNPLINWLKHKSDPLIYEEIKRQAQERNDPTSTQSHLEENMRILTASVIIPSLLEDKFMGFIVLGDKVSGQIYTPEDLNVFQVLASQAALAIENAQFYAETKEMHQQIAQAEKMATIGTMADGLSHQINNRFYALSLIAEDTIDTIKTTDTSKCNPEMKEMIEQINHALQRIQTNVMQGGEVVRGILKYTRKGEEGLDALTLDQIIDSTLDMVQYKVKLSEIDIIRNYDKDIPEINGNLTQLQEVFFNFVDNAYDAIVERRTVLKEPGYRGKISFSAQPKDSKLEILIEDNGIGVKDADEKKLFTPFFTTKTSSRTKGTGLGLYVIKKIITDMHKGKIGFESAYKVGTRFILELPIAR